MKTTVSAALIAGAALSLMAAASASAQITVGAHVATTGIGPDLQYRLNDHFTVRGAADWMDIGANRTYDSVHYDGHLKMATGSAFLDWHPWANAFFLSGGAYFGDRRIDISASPAANVTIGGVSFTPAQVGHLDGRIKMDDASPFVGLGVDTNGGAMKRGLGFKGVLGVAFSGKPRVALTSTSGLLTGQPLLQQAIAQEQANIANKVEFLQTYPVVQAGLTYRF